MGLEGLLPAMESTFSTSDFTFYNYTVPVSPYVEAVVGAGAVELVPCDGAGPAGVVHKGRTLTA